MNNIGAIMHWKFAFNPLWSNKVNILSWALLMQMNPPKWQNTCTSETSADRYITHNVPNGVVHVLNFLMINFHPFDKFGVWRIKYDSVNSLSNFGTYKYLGSVKWEIWCRFSLKTCNISYWGSAFSFLLTCKLCSYICRWKLNDNSKVFAEHYSQLAVIHRRVEYWKRII